MKRIQIVSLSNSADTLKLGLSFDEIGVDVSKFRHQTKDRETGLMTYRHNPETIGISSITCCPETDKLTIETSAKLMQSGYRNGIHIGNLDEYADRINRANVINLKPETLYNAEVYRIDACQTIETSAMPEDVVNALMMLNANPKYRFSPYPKGITLNRKAKTRNDRGNIYGKLDELLMKSNKDFVSQCPEVLKTFTEQSTRFEYQVRKLKDIREVYGVSDTTLGNVLTAKVNPVHHMFQTITKDYNKQLSRIMAISDNLGTAQKMLFIQAHNYDIDAIMVSIGSMVKGKLSRYKREYLDLIAKMQSEMDREDRNAHIINEVDKMLLEAV